MPCVVLHIQCIVNNEGIEEYWIVKIRPKLARRNTEDDLQKAVNCKEKERDLLK